MNHVYLPELIFDRIGNRKLGMSETTLGYFEGCHTFVKSVYPAGTVDWRRYRSKLDEIDGLHIKDLPNLCCKNAASEIIEQAAMMKIDTILCSCNWCSSSLGQAGQGKVKMVSLPELLLRILV